MNPWKAPLLVASLALGVGVSCPACGSGGAEAGATMERSSAGATADMASVEFDVRGMTCGGCALATKAAVQRLDGVRAADAGYDKGSGAGWARVDYDPERVTPEEIAAAISGIGYEPVARADRAR